MKICSDARLGIAALRRVGRQRVRDPDTSVEIPSCSELDDPRPLAGSLGSKGLPAPL